VFEQMSACAPCAKLLRPLLNFHDASGIPSAALGLGREVPHRKHREQAVEDGDEGFKRHKAFSGEGSTLPCLNHSFVALAPSWWELLRGA
jgi:hypothetical protein